MCLNPTIQKRRQEESQRQAEEDFLRASLRGSKKLQALEHNKRPLAPMSTGFVNTAFDDENDLVDDLDDEDSDSLDEADAKAPQPAQVADVNLEERYLKKNVGRWQGRCFTICHIKLCELVFV